MGSLFRQYAAPASLHRHQWLLDRTLDEAGPDEYGCIDRKPGAISGSSFGGVHGTDSRRSATQRTRRQIYSQRSRRGFITPRNCLSKENGIPHSVGLLARGAAVGED